MTKDERFFRKIKLELDKNLVRGRSEGGSTHP